MYGNGARTGGRRSKWIMGDIQKASIFNAMIP